MELSADAIVEEMRLQSRLAVEHGFDGVMTSEHHGGFAGYVPNPLQLAGFLLDAMPRGWAAACPILALLRPAALIAEETAWLAARFPGRVGLGLAAGALPADFDAMDVGMHDLASRFERSLARIAELLRGAADDEFLAGDPALTRCREYPVPILTAAASKTAARRAAAHGAGILLDSLTTPDRCRVLADTYRASGGSEAVYVVRRVWCGDAPRRPFTQQEDVYRGYTPAAAQGNWGSDELITDVDPAEVAARAGAVLRRAGADACNIRVHVPGVDPELARAQIVRLGDEVVPLMRKALADDARLA